MLNISVRNWAVSRSFIVQSLNTEKSQSRKPWSRKILRPAVPNVPVGGAINTELPSTKQPKLNKLPAFGVAELKVPIAVACCVQTPGKAGLITFTPETLMLPGT